jgi:uncharacterized protein YmfQ (DUF2313 family)
MLVPRGEQSQYLERVNGVTKSLRIYSYIVIECIVLTLSPAKELGTVLIYIV